MHKAPQEPKRVRTINAVKWGNRLFTLIDHFRVEIIRDSSAPRWVRARHAIYPPISGNGHDDDSAWDAWREDFAQTYDKAIEGRLGANLAKAILGMVQHVVIERTRPAAPKTRMGKKEQMVDIKKMSKEEKAVVLGGFFLLGNVDFSDPEFHEKLLVPEIRQDLAEVQTIFSKLPAEDIERLCALVDSPHR